MWFKTILEWFMYISRAAMRLLFDLDRKDLGGKFKL